VTQHPNGYVGNDYLGQGQKTQIPLVQLFSYVVWFWLSRAKSHIAFSSGSPPAQTHIAFSGVTGGGRPCRWSLAKTL
jgi:hypothetical protein